jgi:hypothetical protein
MTADDSASLTTVGDVTRSRTLVWLDAREAVIVRWQHDRAHLERVDSEVPAHRRSTGHVRHDPMVRHGGGGGSQTAGEPHRLEHLGQFVEDVASRLAPDDDLLILGPGTVHERLERYVRELDEHLGRHRDISCEASPPLTDRQLVARLRHVAGADPQRRTVGAYRWTEQPPQEGSGQAQARPRRVLQKPPRQPDRGES